MEDFVGNKFDVLYIPPHTRGNNDLIITLLQESSYRVQKSSDGRAHVLTNA